MIIRCTGARKCTTVEKILIVKAEGETRRASKVFRFLLSAKGFIIRVGVGEKEGPRK